MPQNHHQFWKTRERERERERESNKQQINKKNQTSLVDDNWKTKSI